MTNEEKAKELISGMSDKWGSLMAFHKLTQMAEWKDKQFKEYLEKKRQEAQYNNATIISTAIESIIRELFKKD